MRKLNEKIDLRRKFGTGIRKWKTSVTVILFVPFIHLFFLFCVIVWHAILNVDYVITKSIDFLFSV